MAAAMVAGRTDEIVGEPWRHCATTEATGPGPELALSAEEPS